MKKILIAFIVLGALNVQAQLDRSIRPKAAPAPNVNIPESEVFRLPNGVTVILSENHKIPRVSFNLVMGTEPALEKEKAGLAGFAGSMIMTGTSNLSKDQLDLTIDMLGATMSASENNIYASSLTRYTPKLVELMMEVLRNANFPESEFTRLKNQSSSGLTMAKSDANAMASNAVSSMVFGKKHPYGEVMTEETLERITRMDVVDYFAKKFTPDQAYLVVVGDITRKELEQLCANTFAKWDGPKATNNEFKVTMQNNGPRVIFVKKPGAVQSVIQIAFPIDMAPGHKDEVKLKLMNQILGGGTFEARLMQNLREDKAYTYGCYSSVSIDRIGSYFTTNGSFRNEVTDSAIVQILKEIEGMVTAPVKTEELALAKASMTGNFVRSLERPQTIANFALSIIRNKLEKDYYKNYLKLIDETTVEDIQRVAKTYLQIEHPLIIVVGNEKVADNLLVFDKDGKIEFLDAFGNPEVDLKKADISADVLLEKYLLAVTQSKTMKDAAAKIAKINTLKQEMTASPSGMPVSFDMFMYFKAPSKEANEVLFNGQMMQRSFFDGKKGGMVASPMAGGQSSELSEDEVKEKLKTSGLIPELNYAKNGVSHQILGIKDISGKSYYVLEVKTENSVTRDYFNTQTFMKEFSESTTTVGEETSNSNTEYRNFEEVNGILMPKEMMQMIGSMTLTVKVKSVEVNKPIDDAKFVK
jgi:zinc protease